MATHLLKRLLSAVPVMAVVAVIVFLLVHLAPGDPAALIAGDTASPADVAAIRVRLGLDRPLVEQFVLWVGRILSGDLGQSIFSNQPVLHLIGQRLEPTAMLAATTLTVSAVVAVTLGILAAWRAGSLIDLGVMLLAVAGFSVPTFVVGYALAWLFAITLHWLPVQGYVPLAQGLWPCLRSLILPSATLGLAYVALIARITRASMLEVLAEDYMRTARAKGVTTGPLLLHHALRNAAVPIVTVIGIGIALLIGGVVITETVFNLPGIGRLVVDAILKRDYPIIQGVILLFSGVYVVINLGIDMTYALIDPRIRG